MRTGVRSEIRKGSYFENPGVNDRIKIKHLVKNCNVQVLAGFI